MTTERGFTLVELLVAITILGLISLSLLSSLRFGAAAWQRSNGQGGSIEDIEVSESVLRRALISAYPYLPASDAKDPQILFDGAADRITFLAPAPEALGAAGFARFTVAAEPDKDRVRLTIAATPELATATAAVSSSALVDGLSRVGFAYFGTDGPGTAPSWHDAWARRSSLPSLIRISVTFPAGDGRHWPDLTVAPQIAVDEGCVLDLLGHRCQGR